MKTYFIIIVIYFSLINTINAQWTVVFDTTSNYYFTSIYFPNPQTGYVVGRKYSSQTIKGIILKTIDYGNSWNFIDSTNSALSDIFFTDSIHGIVVGQNGTILKTIDGGLTWDSINSGITYDLFSVHFPTQNIGYISGSEGVLKTSDGGNSWNFNNVDSYSCSVYFNSFDTGFVSGHDTILYTTNGGLSWTPTVFNTFSYFTIRFINNNIGFANNSFNLVKTTNGGNTWSILPQNFDIASDFIFVNSDTGFIIGNYYYDPMLYFGNSFILKSSDGGYSWDTLNNIYTNKELYSIFFSDVNTGFISGRGVILKTTNGGATWIQNNDNAHIEGLSIYPNPVNKYLKINFKKNISDQTMLNIAIADLGGRIIQFTSIHSNEPLNISSWPSGIYLIKVYTDKDIAIGKFIKQ